MDSTLFLCLLIITQTFVSPADFDRLARQVPLPLFSTSKVMGITARHNNLTIYTLTKLAHNDLDELQGKPAILINSYMHARQPYSVQMLKRLFEQTVADASAGALDHFMNEGIFIFYPFVNIDGYYSYIQQPEKRDQIRKNMNNSHTVCPRGVSGVDINRNFPANFGTVSSSNDPCGEQYHGAQPFSEVEARVFQAIFSKFRVIVAIDVHSYGNDWIYPYASDSTNQRITQTKTYPLYVKIINEFKSRKRSIKSCMQSLNYIADGVYIDWALDQGALSLAFEVGRTFRSDKDIDDEIDRALEDFQIIFRNARFTIDARRIGDKLQLKSSYFHAVEVLIRIGETTYNQTLDPLGQIELQLPLAATSASLRIGSSKVIQVQWLKSQQLRLSSALVILFALAIIILIFFGCYGCSRCKYKQRTINFNKHQFLEIVEITHRGELGAQI